MEFGLGIPTRGPLTDRAGIETIATRAEALGFSWLAVPDHLIVPRAIDSRYPYSDAHRNRSCGFDPMDCLRSCQRRRDAVSDLQPGGSGGVAELPPSAQHRTAAA